MSIILKKNLDILLLYIMDTSASIIYMSYCCSICKKSLSEPAIPTVHIIAYCFTLVDYNKNFEINAIILIKKEQSMYNVRYFQNLHF